MEFRVPELELIDFFRRDTTEYRTGRPLGIRLESLHRNLELLDRVLHLHLMGPQSLHPTEDPGSWRHTVLEDLLLPKNARQKSQWKEHAVAKSIDRAMQAQCQMMQNLAIRPVSDCPMSTCGKTSRVLKKLIHGAVFNVSSSFDTPCVDGHGLPLVKSQLQTVVDFDM